MEVANKIKVIKVKTCKIKGENIFKGVLWKLPTRNQKENPDTVLEHRDQDGIKRDKF